MFLEAKLVKAGRPSARLTGELGGERDPERHGGEPQHSRLAQA